MEPLLKRQRSYLRKVLKYKYYKNNTNSIIEKYNKELNEYGIEFKYIPYKLKKK